MKIYYLIFLIQLHYICTKAQNKEQKTVIKIDTLNGDVLKDNAQKTINNNYNITVRTSEEDILQAGKYLDLTKDILVYAGRNDLRIQPPLFQHGIHPLGQGPVYIPGGYEIIALKMVDGQLKISAVIRDFDDKVVAKIVNNKLISRGFNRYAGPSYFEVFDDNNIPVLQISFDSKKNRIVLNGAFNHSNGYTILSDQGMTGDTFTREKLLISTHERDSLFLLFKQRASQIKPIHE